MVDCLVTGLIVDGLTDQSQHDRETLQTMQQRTSDDLQNLQTMLDLQKKIAAQAKVNQIIENQKKERARKKWIRAQRPQTFDKLNRQFAEKHPEAAIMLNALNLDIGDVKVKGSKHIKVNIKVEPLSRASRSTASTGPSPDHPLT